jgi:probable phosphoglycerate mutase
MRMHRITSLLALTLLLLVPRAAVAPHAQTAADPLRRDRASAESALRIYLARHGETDWNVEHRLQGWIDRPLDAKGKQQAADLAEALKGIHIDAIYSSTLSRSRDTANIVLTGLTSAAPRGPALQVKSLEGLRERNYGRFQGGSDQDPEYLRRMNAWDDAMEGGETMNQLMARAKASIDQIRREHPTGNVLVVGHRITNQAILRALLDLTPEETTKIDQGNDEVYLIELEAGAKPRLWKLVRARNLGDL